MEPRPMLLLLDDDDTPGRGRGIHFTAEGAPVPHGTDAASRGLATIQHGATTGHGQDAAAKGLRAENERIVTSRSSGEEEG